MDTALTLSQLLNPPGLNELLIQIQSKLGASGFSPTDWETDSDSRLILQVEAQTLADLWQAVLQIAQGGYLDTATGSWLDLLAQSQYQLTRKPAIQTIGNFQLSTLVGTGPYTFNAGDLIVTATGIDGVTPVVFRSTNAVPVTVTSATPVSIEMTADVPGSNANIAANTSFIVQTPRPGLSVINPGSIKPAVVQAALSSGPYALGNKTLIINTSINGGTPTGPVVISFPALPASYPTLSAVSFALNNLINLTILNGKVTSNVINGVFYLTTITPIGATTTDYINIDKTSSANLYIGFSTDNDTNSNGTFGWITQYGQDAETDDSLRQRCKAEWGIVGTGTRDAFISWATTADPQIQKVVVYSNLFDGTPKSGAITLYIAPFKGVFPLPDLIHTPLVYNYILPKLPLMSELFVAPAKETHLTVQAKIQVKTAFNTQATQDAVRNAIQAYFNSLGIGDSFIQDQLLAAIMNVPGIYDVLTLSPVNTPGNIDKVITLGSVSLEWVPV